MTPRERTLACLRQKPVDRIPLVHFGFRRETLQKWAAQGHVSRDEADSWKDGNEADDILSERLDFAHFWEDIRSYTDKLAGIPTG